MLRNFWTGLIVFGVILISIWLQINFFNDVAFFGVKANIGIVLVVTLSILGGQGIGVTVGIVFGMMMDILFGKAFGIATLLFFLTGFFCGKMSKGFSKENKATIIMITIATTVIFDILSNIIDVIVYDYDVELFSMMKMIALESLYNILIARVFFNILSSLAEMINRGKRSYYLL